MSDYNPCKLIDLIGSILEDGEITGDEIYSLAEWLNNNKEDCFNWPGNQLVVPLQEIWTDGKVNKTEIRKMAKLLIGIRKKWARQADPDYQAVQTAAAQVMQNFDPSKAKLPTMQVLGKVKSESDSKKFYNVNLAGPSCNCPDWASKRDGLSTGHLTRCCKHVFKVYNQIALTNGTWLESFLDLGIPPHPDTEWFVFNESHPFTLASSAPVGWSNIFSSESGAYERFGYNIHEDRWSYGTEPSNARQLAEMIRSIA